MGEVNVVKIKCKPCVGTGYTKGQQCPQCKGRGFIEIVMVKSVE